jgi:hypothetical protein
MTFVFNALIYFGPLTVPAPSHHSIFILKGDPNRSTFVNLLVALRFRVPSHPIFQIHNYGAAILPQGFRFIHTRLPYVKHAICIVD